MFLWPTVIVQMQEHIAAGALNILHNSDDSIDAKLDVVSVDSEMDNIAKLYSSFGNSSATPMTNKTSTANHQNANL